MDSLIHTIIGLGILAILLSVLGVSFPTIFKASALPGWARFNSRHSWGNAWIDRNSWLKVIIIRMAQSVIIIFLFFYSFIVIVLKAGLRLMASPIKKK